MLVISAKEQKQALSMQEAIEAVGEALSDYSSGNAISPVRTALPVSKVGGTALFMPSLVEEGAALGIKFVSVFPENKALGKNTINGVLILSDVKTGEPLALLEGSYLTVIRTGAATGLATKYLSKKTSKTLTVIGTGGQAPGLIEAVLAVRQIQEIHLQNRTRKKAVQLAEQLKGNLKHPPTITIFDSADDAILGSDIVVTATNASHPVFSGQVLQKGMHFNAVGAFKPNMQEIPTDVLTQSSKIVVESKDAALEEAGDLIIPIHRGQFQPETIYAELGDILLHKKAGREYDDEITLFESVGLAAMDVVIAKKIYDQAIKKGLGQKVTL